MDCKYVNSWVSQPDVCRCCLSASGSSDITVSYVSDTGQKELYHEMLQVSFGISLSYVTEEGTSRKICNLCIEQLKLAYAFKNQVLQSEKQFNHYYKARAEHGSTQNVEKAIISKELYINKEISPQKDDQVIIELEDAKRHTILNSWKGQPASLKSNSKVKLAQERKKTSKETCEGISKECSVISDYDSDTPIAKIVETFSCQVNREIKSVKKPNITNKSALLNDDEIVGVIEDEHGSTQNVEKAIISKELYINKEISPQKDDQVIIELEDAKRHTILNSWKGQPASLKSNSKVKLAQERKKTSKETCEGISKECSVISDYDSDTPIAKIVETFSCQVNREIKSVKKPNITNKSAMLNDDKIVGVIEDAPSRPRSAKIRDIKHISERKRVKITCLTILRDTTACPFRHYKSWFRCFFCLKDFMKMQSLKEHTFTTHTNIETELQKMKRYPRSLQIEISEVLCKKCGFKMESVATLKKHLQLAHEEIIYSECIADYKVDTAPYSCHICGEQFHVFRTLTTHLNIHYANFICDVCGRPFLNTKRLKVHYRVHEKGTFPCNLCSKVLTTKSSRSNHMESAHSKRILRCHVCQKPMKHYNARVKHMSEAHHITHNFKCTICGREYNVKHYLATHMRQSHGAKDKKCEECGMAFITSHGLKKHMRKHTGEKLFNCPVCKKSYARGYSLKEHMRIHNSLPASTEKFNDSLKML